MTELQDHPDYRQLVNAVRAAPDDDLPRLVMADWLEEHDAPEWAEFIRVHCEAARHPHAARIWADTFTDGEAVNPEWQRALTCARLVRELWPKVAEMICSARNEGERALVTWDGRCFFGDPRGSRPQFEARRGLVEWVRSSVAEWMDAGYGLLGSYMTGRQPIRTVEFSDRECGRDGHSWWAIKGSETLDVPVAISSWVPWSLAVRFGREDNRQSVSGGRPRRVWYFPTREAANTALSAAAIAWALEEAGRVG